jgi:hypothetical protein
MEIAKIDVPKMGAENPEAAGARKKRRREHRRHSMMTPEE